MYSFRLSESETWTIWPDHLSLSMFTSGRSNIIITQIFRYISDAARDEVNMIKNNILDQKSTLVDKVSDLKMALADYQKTVEVGDDFVR